MSDYLMIVALATVIIICTSINRYFKRKKKLRKVIQDSWSVLPENCYDEYDYKSFSQLYFFRKHKSLDMIIDDITWNDLEMDSFYSLINSTMTSMGDNVLYSLLRTPLYDKDRFINRMETVDYWADHRDDREKTQVILTNFGKFRPSRIDVLIDKCDFLKLKNQWVFKLLTFSPILALPLFLFSIGYGVLWIIFSLGINALYHESKVKEIHLGLEAVTQATRIVTLAKKLYKNKPSGLNEKYERLKTQYKKLKPILRKGSLNSVLVGLTGNMGIDILSMFNMVFLVDLWAYQSSIKFIESHHEDFDCLIDAVGEIDATISIASYREYLSDESNNAFCCNPEILWNSYNDNFYIHADDVLHPLIKNCAPNPINSIKPTLVTGSNASGKSTYLKTIVINTLLAHTLGFCLAKKWTSRPLFPITSMALRDSIINGESYFIAEIKSLKRIFSSVNNEITCLCVIDEVLRGTNTVERIAASSRILYALASENTCIFAATHDIELTNILSDVFTNKHFEEIINDDDIKFDYTIKDGKAKSRNAIKLLKIMGFSEDVIKKANNAVEAFEQQNRWTKLEGD